MERDQRTSLSWLVGVIALVLTVPALIVFVERDALGVLGTHRSESSTISTPFPGAGPNGVVEVGVGKCTVNPDAILIEGSGMTACRAPEWTTVPYFDQQVSVDAFGIDAGATVVFRFREFGSRRLEVAIGRTAVVIREKTENDWTVLASIPREVSTTESVPPASSSTSAVHRLKISLAGELVSVAIDDIETAGARTSISDPGLFSVGAITSDSVAVRLYSVSVTDAG